MNTRLVPFAAATITSQMLLPQESSGQTIQVQGVHEFQVDFDLPPVRQPLLFTLLSPFDPTFTFGGVRLQLDSNPFDDDPRTSVGFDIVSAAGLVESALQGLSLIHISEPTRPY